MSFIHEMNLKVGVAIPCHEKDFPLLLECLYGIQNMSPPAFDVFIDFNRGKRSMKEIRVGLFERAFNNGCDVVLSCDADFYLFPDILNHVRKDRVVSFMGLARKYYDVTMGFYNFIFRNGWFDCYSIPKKIWFNRVKERFNGFGRSVPKALGKRKWKLKGYKYYSLRPYEEQNTRRELKRFSLLKRIFWQVWRLKVVKL